MTAELLRASRFSLLGAIALLRCASNGFAQAPSISATEKAGSYSLSVPVNEVEITFHAADAHDIPVVDLSSKEVDVFDNGSGPGQIIGMQLLHDRPVHVAIAIDTSSSVALQVAENRNTAREAFEKLLTNEADMGTVLAFGRSKHILQGWTSDRSTLIRSVSQVDARTNDPIDGTGLYDTLFSTCLYEFGEDRDRAAARVIFLFSDGVDTASHTSMQTAIERCSKSHTAIYAFSPKPAADAPSLGPAALRQITEETGGRLFFTDGLEAERHVEIDAAAMDLKNEYLLLYRPARLKHDGSFHKIVLVGPKRVATIVGTSGFYDSTLHSTLH